LIAQAACCPQISRFDDAAAKAVSEKSKRACFFALCVAAVLQMGVLQQARFIASNSGGSWFNGAMSYTQVSSLHMTQQCLQA
jgi:hypothetical protein